MAKRCRTPELNREYIDAIERLFPGVKTERGLISKGLMIRAFGALRDKKDSIDNLEYLISKDGKGLNEPVLTELGRFGTEAEIIDTAMQACAFAREHSVSVRDMAKIVRIVRFKRDGNS